MYEFAFVTLYVRDMERSLHFYHNLLGLPIVARHPAGPGEMAMLGHEGQPLVELLYDPSRLPAGHMGFSVGLRVDSLDDALSQLDGLGYPALRGPFSPDPSVRFSFVNDPDGIEVQLIEYL